MQLGRTLASSLCLLVCLRFRYQGVREVVSRCTGDTMSPVVWLVVM